MSQNISQWQSQNPNAMPARVAQEPPKEIPYLCGDCGATSLMKAQETVRCKECGHRVMYKPRTHRIVQFEAR